MISWVKKWICFVSKKEVWEYGRMSNSGKVARRNKVTGKCQFVLWKKGDQKEVDGIGHTEDKWVDFGIGHETFFVPDSNK